MNLFKAHKSGILGYCDFCGSDELVVLDSSVLCIKCKQWKVSTEDFYLTLPDSLKSS